jgi:hypothetical protein
MRQVMVRYKVKAGQSARNEQLVRAVYDELREAAPAGFGYATFRLDDGQTFVHLAVTEADDGPSPLAGIEAFGRFQDGIADRCEEPPQVAEVQQVGSYRLFGA